MLSVIPVRPLAIGGLAASVFGVLAVTSLHLLPPTDRINPIRRTLSEYALHDTAWIFNLGVLALAFGSSTLLIALIRSGLTTMRSAGGVGLALWCAGLAAVVWFPKHNWSVGPSADGDIHRVASLVAFVSLPIAALAISRAHLRDDRRRHCARWTMACAILALLWFAVIIGAVILEPITGVRWWRAIPLGAVERGLATAEVATVFALGWWALAETRSRLPVPVRLS